MIPAPRGTADPVSLLLEDRIRSLFKNLPLALAGDEEPIHDIRVAARRLRVLLPLVARKPKGRKVRKTSRKLRALTRTAGSSRDFDVCLKLFEAHIPWRGGSNRTAALLRRRLEGARTRAWKRMVDALLDLDISGMRRGLRKVASRGGADVFTVLLRLRQMREEEGGALLEALERIGGRFDPMALHELRGQVRRLRYASEVSNALAGTQAEATGQFENAQDTLGELHDASVLVRWLDGQALAALKRGRALEAAAARTFETQFLDVSRALHAKFLDTHPASRLRQALSWLGRNASAA